MSIKFVISDAIGNEGHANTIRAAAILGSNGLLSNDDFAINLQNVLSAYALAVSEGALGLIRCFGTIGGIQAIAGEQYRQYGILSFMALGSNSPVRLIFTPDKITSVVACGAGDTQNRTGSGWSTWFYDQDTINNGLWESSYSTGYIAGLIYRIKVTVGCSWWEALYRARVTASENDVQDIVNGFGKIDFDAAVAFAGAIPDDPFQVIGEVGELSLVQAGNQVTLTATWVDNLNQLTFEKNVGDGWVAITTQTYLELTTYLSANVETQFRYKAINENESSEYSEVVSALWEVLPEPDPVPIEEQVIGWYERRPRRSRLGQRFQSAYLKKKREV